MTLLHQAAQKAVEAPEYKPAGAPMEVWNSPFYDLQTRLEICAGAVAFEREVSANMRRQRDEARAALSALQQQPEPADSLLASHLAYTRAHLPALQHQEVPREPEELRPGEALRRDGIVCGRCGCQDLMYEGTSATRQQEVGSRPYRTSAGDTLRGIAHRELGDAARWPEIKRLNMYAFDPESEGWSRPRAGTLLTLPAAPSTPENAGGVRVPVVAWHQRYCEVTRAACSEGCAAGPCKREEKLG